ncbi:MAG: hypothetical protein GEU90_20740 [Gemmatimonas sp.]|nr:hypothetical protein [Gemmatimonas sp.]
MTLFLPFVAAFATALLLTPAIRSLARKVGLIARPSQDRWHAKPTALLGGAAVYGAFLVGTSVALFVASAGTGAVTAIVRNPAIGIVIASSLMFLVGLADDRFHLRPSTKLIFQGLAATIVISFGVVYPVTGWQVINVLVTFFWFLALTNALNLLDNMDGVAVGVAAVAALFLAVTFQWEGAALLAAICMALVGAAVGFLPFNFHRASIFMGDSGSLFIGSLLAGLAASYPNTASVSIVAVLFVPAAIAVIPILDTVLVTITRTVAGRPISVGGRDHTTHRLVAMGLSERQVALLLYAFAAVGGLVAIGLRGAPPGIGMTAGGIFLVALLASAAYLGQIHTYSPADAPRGRATLLISNLLYKRRALEVVLDLIIFTVAYQLAYLLRWDGQLPAEQWAIFESTVAIAAVSKLVMFGIRGVYRGSWSQLNLRDAIHLVQATVLGSLVTVAAVMFFFPSASVSRSVLILDGVLVALLTLATRASFRTLDLLRHSLREAAEPVLIYGAGKGGELAVRELLGNADLQMTPVGFLDDDPSKLGRLVQGYPVLGDVAAARNIIPERGIKRVILGSRALLDEHVESLCTACRSFDVEIFRLELTFRPVGGKAAIAVDREPQAKVRAVPLQTA